MHREISCYSNQFIGVSLQIKELFKRYRQGAWGVERIIFQNKDQIKTKCRFWHEKKPANIVFTSFVFKQITGVEPASPVWETGVMTAILYLHYRHYYTTFQDTLQVFFSEKKTAA